MDSCDVLVVGGGPAGSTCARMLVRAGLDVVVIDRATFPRDKVCAGWITPQVVSDLDLDVDHYRRGRTFQPITAFRTGLLDSDAATDTTYTRPVSYGIRRCEFDDYLLRRSGARLRLGAPVSSIRRTNDGWNVDETVSCSMLVGAGGHFCPVARLISPEPLTAPLVVAQEAEFAIEDGSAGAYATEPERPELYFCRDLKGYGWCFRKQRHVNVGLGRLDRHSLPQETARFVDFLKRTRRIPAFASWRWKGHAYLVATDRSRRLVDDNVLLVGDAAGVAYPQSGEGIRPAIESGIIAAEAIAAAGGHYTRARLAEYAHRLRSRFGVRQEPRVLSLGVPEAISEALAPPLFRSAWFVRHFVLDRWFLRAHEAALSLG